jgi:hypothetical protein
MTQRTITYQYDGGTGYDIRFPYDPTLVSVIKTIPASQRSWDPGSKSWWVHKHAFDVLRRSVDQALPGTIWVNIGEPDPPPKPPPRKPSTKPTLERVFVDLFDLLPPTLVKPVRVALLHAVHPDHGGDHETAVALNAALQTVGTR